MKLSEPIRTSLLKDSSRAFTEERYLSTDSQSGVTIYAVTLATGGLDDSDLNGLGDWLDEEECAKAAKFVYARDRRDYIAAHALLRMQLRKHVCEVPFPARYIRNGKLDKPRLSDITEHSFIDFSLSHADGIVACAVARGVSIGIDCEPLSRITNQDIITHCCSAYEIVWIQSQAALISQHAFLHIWTLKEAVTKAVGLGLSANLKGFTVLPSAPPGLLTAALNLALPNNGNSRSGLVRVGL